jgi:16S rRNA (adenine1518-N6/adenine1519-N6)-dimethyltransferase
MPLYRPGELFSFLENKGLKPRKSLSQNFLIDGNIVNQILKTANVEKGDHILEVGPGPGVLTEALLKKGAKVTTVEKDRGFAEALHRLSQKGDLTVIQADALTLDLDKALPQTGQKRMKLLANLPYNITSPLLIQFAPLSHFFEKIVVMVQKEVAERITAKPKTKAYGSLTLYLEFFCERSYNFTVKRTCFYPVPNVDSAVITLLPKTSRLLPQKDEEAFFKMVRVGFQQRRKMLKGTLKNAFPTINWEALIEKLGTDPKVRPEELDLSTFVKLYVLAKEFGKDLN